MWDINSLENKDPNGWHDAGLVDEIKKDWKHLVNDLGITKSSRYLKHNGRPLVAIWGVNKKDVMDADGYDLPSDWYLRLTGEAAKMLRGEIGLTSTIPINH